MPRKSPFPRTLTAATTPRGRRTRTATSLYGHSKEPVPVTYHVVVNHEEQYSIWPADRRLPDGWRPDGVSGSKQECLDHIEQVWTDLRPKSAR